MTSELHSLCFLFLPLERGRWRSVGHHILRKAFVFHSVSWTEASWAALLTTMGLVLRAETEWLQSALILSLHRFSEHPEQMKWAGSSEPTWCGRTAGLIHWVCAEVDTSCGQYVFSSCTSWIRLHTAGTCYSHDTYGPQHQVFSMDNPI